MAAIDFTVIDFTGALLGMLVGLAFLVGLGLVALHAGGRNK
jgi:hypothetical protein